VVPSALILMACLSACQTLPQPTPIAQGGSWTLFTDTAGGFSVLMPIRPKEEVETQFTTNGPSVKVHEFVVDPSPSLELSVMYNDFPMSLSKIWAVGTPAWFDAVQEGAMKELGKSRLISASDGRYGSNPMRELRFELPNKKITCQMRFILVGLRMYQLIVVSSVMPILCLKPTRFLIHSVCCIWSSNDCGSL
jgi:hypothetical protein